jgi:hypothetical protein
MRYVLTTLALHTDGTRLVAPFPTYTLIAGPFAGNKALIRIPDEDIADELGALPASATQKLSVWLAARGVPQARIDAAVTKYGDPDVTLALDPATQTRLVSRLDNRYREHKGEFGGNIG